MMNALLRNRNLIPLSSSSPCYFSSSPVLPSFLPHLMASLSIYPSVSVCISLSLRISDSLNSLPLSLLQIVCHLCDQWNSFFSGNSPMMDFFFAVLCVFSFFFFGGGIICFCESKLWLKQKQTDVLIFSRNISHFLTFCILTVYRER